jgi:hypothetical protein
MSKVYISGPMTGYPEYNRPAFSAAADYLRDRGYEPVNPAEVELGPGATWEQYMREDLKLLMDCEAVVLLPGWEKSRGATLEASIAGRLGMTVRPLEEFS